MVTETKGSDREVEKEDFFFFCFAGQPLLLHSHHPLHSHGCNILLKILQPQVQKSCFPFLAKTHWNGKSLEQRFWAVSPRMHCSEAIAQKRKMQSFCTLHSTVMPPGRCNAIWKGISLWDSRPLQGPRWSLSSIRPTLGLLWYNAASPQLTLGCISAPNSWSTQHYPYAASTLGKFLRDLFLPSIQSGVKGP